MLRATRDGRAMRLFWVLLGYLARGGMISLYASERFSFFFFLNMLRISFSGIFVSLW